MKIITKVLSVIILLSFTALTVVAGAGDKFYSFDRGSAGESVTSNIVGFANLGNEPISGEEHSVHVRIGFTTLANAELSDEFKFNSSGTTMYYMDDEYIEKVRKYVANHYIAIDGPSFHNAPTSYDYRGNHIYNAADLWKIKDLEGDSSDEVSRVTVVSDIIDEIERNAIEHSDNFASGKYYAVLSQKAAQDIYFLFMNETRISPFFYNDAMADAYGTSHTLTPEIYKNNYKNTSKYAYDTTTDINSIRQYLAIMQSQYESHTAVTNPVLLVAEVEVPVVGDGRAFSEYTFNREHASDTTSTATYNKDTYRPWLSNDVSYYASVADMFQRCGGDYHYFRSPSCDLTVSANSVLDYWRTEDPSTYNLLNTNFSTLDLSIAGICGYYKGLGAEAAKWPYRWTEDFFGTTWSGVGSAGDKPAMLAATEGHRWAYSLLMNPKVGYKATDLPSNVANANTTNALKSFGCAPMAFAGRFTPYAEHLDTAPLMGFDWELYSGSAEHGDIKVAGGPEAVNVRASVGQYNASAWVAYLLENQTANFKLTFDTRTLAGRYYSAGQFFLFNYPVHYGSSGIAAPDVAAMNLHSKENAFGWYYVQNLAPQDGSYVRSKGIFDQSAPQMTSTTYEWSGSGAELLRRILSNEVIVDYNVTYNQALVDGACYITAATFCKMYRNGQPVEFGYAGRPTEYMSRFGTTPKIESLYNRATHWIGFDTGAGAGHRFSGTLFNGRVEVKSNSDKHNSPTILYTADGDQPQLDGANEVDEYTDKDTHLVGSDKCDIYNVFSGVPTTTDLYIATGEQVWRATVQYVYAVEDYQRTITMRNPPVDNYSYWKLNDMGAPHIASDDYKNNQHDKFKVTTNPKTKDSERTWWDGDTKPAPDHSVDSAYINEYNSKSQQLTNYYNAGKAAYTGYAGDWYDAMWNRVCAVLAPGNLSTNKNDWCADNNTQYNKIDGIEGKVTTDDEFKKYRDQVKTYLEGMKDAVANNRSYSDKTFRFEMINTKDFEGSISHQRYVVITIKGPKPPDMTATLNSCSTTEHTWDTGSTKPDPNDATKTLNEHKTYYDHVMGSTLKYDGYTPPSMLFSYDDKGTISSPLSSGNTFDQSQTNVHDYTVTQTFRNVAFLQIVECHAQYLVWEENIGLDDHLAVMGGFEYPDKTVHYMTAETGNDDSAMTRFYIPDKLGWETYLAGVDPRWANGAGYPNNTTTVKSGITATTVEGSRPWAYGANFISASKNLESCGRLINSYFYPNYETGTNVRNYTELYFSKDNGGRVAKFVCNTAKSSADDNVKITIDYKQLGGRDYITSPSAQILAMACLFGSQFNSIAVIDDSMAVQVYEDAGGWWQSYCGGDGYNSALFAKDQVASGTQANTNNLAQHLLRDDAYRDAKEIYSSYWEVLPLGNSSELCPKNDYLALQSKGRTLFNPPYNYEYLINLDNDTVSKYAQTRNYHALTYNKFTFEGAGISSSELGGQPYMGMTSAGANRSSFTGEKVVSGVANGNACESAAYVKPSGLTTYNELYKYSKSGGKFDGNGVVNSGTDKPSPLIACHSNFRDGTGTPFFNTLTASIGNKADIGVGVNGPYMTNPAGTGNDVVNDYVKTNFTFDRIYATYKDLNIPNEVQNGTWDTGAQYQAYYTAFFETDMIEYMIWGNDGGTKYRIEKPTAHNGTDYFAGGGGSHTLGSCEPYGYGCDNRTSRCITKAGYWQDITDPENAETVRAGILPIYFQFIASSSTYNGNLTGSNVGQWHEAHDPNRFVVYNPVAMDGTIVNQQTVNIGDVDDENAVSGTNGTPVRDQRIDGATLKFYDNTESYIEADKYENTRFNETITSSEKYRIGSVKPDGSIVAGTIVSCQPYSKDDYDYEISNSTEIKTIGEGDSWTFNGTDEEGGQMRATLWDNNPSGSDYTNIAIPVSNGDTFTVENGVLYREAKNTMYTIDDVLHAANGVTYDGATLSVNEAGQACFDTIDLKAFNIKISGNQAFKKGDVLDFQMNMGPERHLTSSDFDTSESYQNYINDPYQNRTLPNYIPFAVGFDSIDTNMYTQTRLTDGTIEHIIVEFLEDSYTNNMVITTYQPIWMFPSDYIMKYRRTFIARYAYSNAGGNNHQLVEGNISPTKTTAENEEDMNKLALTADKTIGNAYNGDLCDTWPTMTGSQTIGDRQSGKVNIVAYVNKASSSLSIEASQNPHKVPVTNYKLYLLGQKTNRGNAILNLDDPLLSYNKTTFNAGATTINMHEISGGDGIVMKMQDGQWLVTTKPVLLEYKAAVNNAMINYDSIATFWIYDVADGVLFKDNPDAYPLSKSKAFDSPGTYSMVFKATDGFNKAFDTTFKQGSNNENWNQAYVYPANSEYWATDWAIVKTTYKSSTQLARERSADYIQLDNTFSITFNNAGTGFCLDKGTNATDGVVTQTGLAYDNENNIPWNDMIDGSTDLREPSYWIAEKYVEFPFPVYTNPNPAEPITYANSDKLVYHPAYTRVHLGVFVDHSLAVDGNDNGGHDVSHNPGKKGDLAYSIAHAKGLLEEKDYTDPMGESRKRTQALAIWTAGTASLGYSQRIAENNPDKGDGGRYVAQEAGRDRGNDWASHMTKGEVENLSEWYSYTNKGHFYDFGELTNYQYYFYLPLEAGECIDANIKAVINSINSPYYSFVSSEMNNLSVPTRNHVYETVNNTFTTDIVGRIGGLSIVDTGDFRYSDTFKYGKASEYSVYGLIHKLGTYDNQPADAIEKANGYADTAKQKLVVADPWDVRGRLSNLLDTETVSLPSTYNKTVDLNTYNTQWQKSVANDTTLRPLPLTSTYNIHDSLKSTYPTLGYATYLSLETIGSYYGDSMPLADYSSLNTNASLPTNNNNDFGQNKVQIIPVYYGITYDPDAVDDPATTDKDERITVQPVDIYMRDTKDAYVKINTNMYGNTSEDMLNTFIQNKFFVYDKTNEDLEFALGDDVGVTNKRKLVTVEEAGITRNSVNTYNNELLKSLKFIDATNGWSSSIINHLFSSDNILTNPARTLSLRGSAGYNIYNNSSALANHKGDWIATYGLRNMLSSYKDVLGTDTYTIGNGQVLFLRDKNRTFIGDTTNGIQIDKQVHSENNSNTHMNAQKYYFNLRLPSSAIIVPSTHIGANIPEFALGRTDPTDKKKYYLLTTLNIRAKGNVWTLQYESPLIHQNFNLRVNDPDDPTTIDCTVHHKEWNPDENPIIPVVINEITNQLNSTVDYNTVGTH